MKTKEQPKYVKYFYADTAQWITITHQCEYVAPHIHPILVMCTSVFM